MPRAKLGPYRKRAATQSPAQTAVCACGKCPSCREILCREPRNAVRTPLEPHGSGSSWQALEEALGFAGGQPRNGRVQQLRKAL